MRAFLQLPLDDADQPIDGGRESDDHPAPEKGAEPGGAGSAGEAAATTGEALKPTLDAIARAMAAQSAINTALMEAVGRIEARITWLVECAGVTPSLKGEVAGAPSSRRATPAGGSARRRPPSPTLERFVGRPGGGRAAAGDA